jgi:pyridinium-3,5-bisthiocarboxylic acid mononucleotide nickel chelatase
MPRTAWFHCFAGTAGDMTLGALVHAGADQLEIADVLGRLALDGYAVSYEAVQRCGIAAMHAVVVIGGHHEHPAADAEAHLQDAEAHLHDHHHDDDHGHHHRPYREIRDLLDAADLPARVRDRAQRTFRALAEVEGAMHRMDPDDVELHEVGSLDAIVDIVGACAALESLGVDRIVCSPITVGQGTVRAAHGVLPNPAPATMELLARRGAPSRGIDDRRELATPTGVALMTALADEFGPLPAMDVVGVGYGAGTSDIEGRPNVVQVVVGESPDAPASAVTPDPGQPVQLLETNVDDATGEVIAHTIAALIAAGAHDAWATPIVMKKGRPAHTVHALCDPLRSAAVGAVLVRETGTLGLRGTVMQRWPQARDEGTVTVDGHVVRVKLTAGRVKVEHDDAAAAAAALGRPLRDVLHAAESAAAAGRMQP